jgi:hypothetical protein
VKRASLSLLLLAWCSCAQESVMLQTAEKKGVSFKIIQVDLAFPLGIPYLGNGHQFTLEQETKDTDGRLHGAD